jgi:hypothetical protein
MDLMMVIRIEDRQEYQTTSPSNSEEDANRR